MTKRYDRYEIEIIISLGFLVLFLISTNFISGYSFEQAKRGQAAQFENSLSMAANFIQSELEKDLHKWGRSEIALGDRLQDLSVLTNIDRIVVSDTSGRITAAAFSTSSQYDSDNVISTERRLKGRDGKLFAYLTVAKTNILGEKFRSLSRWDTIFRVAGLLAALIAGGYFLRAVLYPYRRIKREAMDYNLDLKDESYGIEYIVSTFKDVIAELEEKRSQLEVMYKSSEKRADSLARYNEYILGSITSGVVICDSNGVITRFNRSAENILNYFERNCRGKHYHEIFGNSHRLTSMLDDALRDGKVHSLLEFEIKRPDGERLWLGCSSSMINDEKGEGMGAVLLMIDLTEIRRLQEISSYSEKMASVGEMAAGLAHEIRNSFAAIHGFANLIGKSGDVGDDSAKLIGSIKDESMAAEELLSRFLNFARPLELRPEVIDMRQMIDSIINGISHPDLAKINLKIRIEENLPKVTIDPALLRQAITNLLLNACDAVQDGGDILVEVRIDERKNTGSHRNLRISVADTGIGISPESKRKIFEPFYTNKPNGIGLGLALVKKIVVLHRGRIEVESRPNKGTKFIIYIPFDHTRPFPPLGEKNAGSKGKLRVRAI